MPNGPRRPTSWPTRAEHSAALTAPTARIVWVSACEPAVPLTETGISPMPNAYSMVNWPGRTKPTGLPAGASVSVTVSCVSSRRALTR